MTRRPKKRSAWNLKEKIDFCLKHIQALYGQVKTNMAAIEEITKILDEEGLVGEIGLHGEDPEEADENPEGPRDGGHPEGGDHPDGVSGYLASEPSPPES